METDTPVASATALWQCTRPIRFSHCDPAGIVYYARYFDLFNGVVEDWFAEALALDYRGFILERRIGLGYAHASADFARPARMGDRLVFSVTVDRIGGKSLTLAIDGSRDGEAIVAGKLVIVTTDMAAERAIDLPPDLRASVTRYKERTA